MVNKMKTQHPAPTESTERRTAFKSLNFLGDALRAATVWMVWIAVITAAISLYLFAHEAIETASRTIGVG